MPFGMPGMGMPPVPPMAPTMGMPGMGMPGMGPPGMGPQASIQALDRLAQQQAGSGEKDALLKAQGEIQAAMAKVMFRSPKAAKALADALGKLNQALMTLEQEASQPVAPPPDLFGALGSAQMGPPPMGALLGGGGQY